MSSVTRRLGAGEPLNDPQAVHVSEGLVEGPQGAQLLGLVDDRRDGAADAAGEGDSGPSIWGESVASTTVYINLR